MQTSQNTPAQDEVQDYAAWAGLNGIGRKEVEEYLTDDEVCENRLAEDHLYQHLLRNEEISKTRLQILQRRLEAYGEQSRKLEQPAPEFPEFAVSCSWLMIGGAAVILAFGYLLLVYWNSMSSWPLAFLLIAGIIIVLFSSRVPSAGEKGKDGLLPGRLFLLSAGGLILWLIADGWLGHRNRQDILRVVVSAILFLLTIAGIRYRIGRHMSDGMGRIGSGILLPFRLVRLRLYERLTQWHIRRQELQYSGYHCDREQRMAVIRSRWNCEKRQLYRIWRRGAAMRDILGNGGKEEADEAFLTNDGNGIS